MTQIFLKISFNSWHRYMLDQKESTLLRGHHLEPPVIDTRIDIEVTTEEIVEYTTSEEEDQETPFLSCESEK